jgi:diketogulonate reductase-like aldo/keto reductase
MYRNEKGCGRAIQNSGLDRADVFLTTKIPPESMGYQDTKRAVDSSLRQAGQEYFDLYVYLSSFQTPFSLETSPAM